MRGPHSIAITADSREYVAGMARATVLTEAHARKLHVGDLVKVEGHRHVHRVIAFDADGAHLTDVIAYPRVDLRGIRPDRLTVAASFLA